jgi:hypothetical protein
MLKKRLSKKDRIHAIRRGFIKPETAVEWAIFHEHTRKVNARKIAVLHDHAAINKPHPLDGMVVVVPPKEK